MTSWVNRTRILLAAAVTTAVVVCTPLSESLSLPDAPPQPGAAESGGNKTAAEPVRPEPSTVRSDDAVDYVLAISVDGLRPNALQQLGRQGVPNFYRMINGGASTLNARTEQEATITLPNHTGMVTGRWITKQGGHHVLFNVDNGKTVHAAAGGHVDSMFSVVHDRGGSTRFYSAKEKFAFLDRSWNAQHGGADRVGANNGTDKIDNYFWRSEPELVTMLINRLRTQPDKLSFLHLAYPDSAGHRSGWTSQAYLNAVRQADAQLGRILNAVRANARLRAHLNIVLTADHGGQGKDHSDASARLNYTIPFMVWGVGVSAGADLYALNSSSRKRPGTARTSYSGTQPIRNGDLANLVTDLLDLPAVPGSTFNTRQNLNPS